MTAPAKWPTDEDLEHRLVALGRSLTWPEVDVAGPVLARLAAPTSRPATGRRRARRVAVPAVALAGLVATAAVAAVLDIPGFRFIIGDQSTDLPLLVEDPTFLGPIVSLAEARSLASFELLLPGRTDIEVHVSGAGEDARVSLVHPMDADLQPIGASRAGAVVTEFLGRVDPDLFTKVIKSDGVVESVAVGDTVGLWVEGPHTVFLRDRRGDVVELNTGLAGNVLVFQVGDVSVRVEVAGDLASALTVARALLP